MYNGLSFKSREKFDNFIINRYNISKMKMQGRLNLWIDREIQMRFVVYALLSLAIGCIIVSVVTFYSVWIDVGEKILRNNAIGKIYTSSLSKFVSMSFALIIILAVLTTLGMLMLSHKIAGPVYRIKKILKELQEGKHPAFNLRKGDALKSVAEELEKLAAQQRSIGESALRVVETWKNTEVKDMSLNLALKELENRIIYLSIEQNKKEGGK